MGWLRAAGGEGGPLKGLGTVIIYQLGQKNELVSATSDTTPPHPLLGSEGPHFRSGIARSRGFLPLIL